jgi:hypothetical protein
MRWDDLFADLEGQAAAMDVAARAAEVDERTRIERAGLSVVDRLSAAVGTAIRLQLLGDLIVSGTLDRVGPDWLLLEEDRGFEAVVRLAGVHSIAGLGRWSAVPGRTGAVHARLTLRSALRGIARDRSGVRLYLVDGAVLSATLDRVGADFVEAALHAPGEPRRRAEVRDVQLVPFKALAAVTRVGG